MSEDFRQQLNRKLRMQRLHEAIEAYKEAVDTAWYTFCQEAINPPKEEQKCHA